MPDLSCFESGRRSNQRQWGPTPIPSGMSKPAHKRQYGRSYVPLCVTGLVAKPMVGQTVGWEPADGY